MCSITPNVTRTQETLVPVVLFSRLSEEFASLENHICRYFPTSVVTLPIATELHLLTNRTSADPNCQTRLTAKFMYRGFTALPQLVQRHWQAPDHPLDDEDGNVLCEVPSMTPTEFSIMTDIWSQWWEDSTISRRLSRGPRKERFWRIGSES